jgi:hypothetical protein
MTLDQLRAAIPVPVYPMDTEELAAFAVRLAAERP